MNSQQIKEKMMEDADLIIKVLESCEFHHIRFKERNSEIRCAYDEESNPEAIMINTDTLRAFDYGRNINGDIFTLVQHKMGMKNFGETYRFVCSVLGISPQSSFVRRKFFGGHFSKMNSIEQEEEYIYPEDYLEKNYTRVFNERFLNDGISLFAQFRYNLHFDDETQRIIVPYMTENGLVGTTGRYNADHKKDDVPKWKVIDNFKKGDYLYGLYHNYNDIIRRNLVVVTESEKSPMQMSTMGFHYGVAVGSHSISQKQASQLRHLAQTIIVAFDEGISEETIIEQCRKIKQGMFSKVRVGYIYDRENKYLKKGSLSSPTDHGRDVFLALCRECVIYI